MGLIPKNKLTKQFLQNYADEQIAKYLSVGPVNEGLAEQYLAEAYKVANLAVSKFIWYDSPKQWDSVGASVGASVGGGVGASVRASVWASVRDSVRDSVGASVGASVWASVGDSVGASVWASVRDSVGASVRDSVRAWYGAPHNSELKFFNDYMQENDFRHICMFEEMVNGYYLTAKTAHIIRKPIFLSRDEQGRLHNDQRAAIEWGDGFKIFYLHGQEFDEKLFHQVTNPKFNLKQLMKIENADQRTEAWRILKPSEILKGMKAKHLHTGQRGTKLYQVDNFMDTGETEYCMVMDDSSTDRQFLEWVDPKVGKLKDADEAQAAAWGIPKEDYLLLEQEA